ncbi:hypothetical protein VNO77_17766 [Canavalia gladiata]|uniref:ABC transporter domain-containing protein n=1 Tax=Canavalia gladiata TaxID=3824 RepID=A0AAN9QN04_CANGL
MRTTSPSINVFNKTQEDNEEDLNLKWAEIQRLPIFDRMRNGMLRLVLDNGNVTHRQINVTNLDLQDKKMLLENVLEDDNEKFLSKFRERVDRVGIELPKIEVRYENLSVEGDVYVGSRALPTLLNATLNTFERILGMFHFVPSKKRKIHILKDLSGIIKPSRMTLLLGPPGAGKTTFLLALAGKLDQDLRASGRITYCGHELNEFVAKKTCAYIGQHDLHYGEMTVRETLDFAGRCLGDGTRYEMLEELSRREKQAEIKPDLEIDVFMKAIAILGQKTNLITDYIIKILGLDICADIKVGDNMRRGISGGQKKRVTTGEMLENNLELRLRLPVFYKQRDFMFYPAWAFGLPIWLLRIPLSFVESGLWIALTYYTIGFAPSASRFFRHFLALFGVHQMAISLYRLIGAIGRIQVVSNILSGLICQVIFVLGGFIVAKNDIKPWMIWGYYVSPMMYGQNAIVMNEFLDERWSQPSMDPEIDAPTIGKVLLKSRGFYTEDYWFWICIGALFGFALLFNLLFIAALTYLNPFGDSKVFIIDEGYKSEKSTSEHHVVEDMAVKNSSEIVSSSDQERRTRVVLSFQPLSLAFNHVNYFVDMPAEMKSQGINEDKLQLLNDVSGAFRPRILTALMGVSGAGKTTLMDVLVGRKTGGYTEGSISISGYPKNQATFARVSGYCEQNDIHSPYVTVYESLLFSAWLRLPSDVNTQTRKMFVEEVMEWIELKPIRDALVGLPGIDGLSTEQRKRLTIAVELVANPSIIFMDEPTSGLDARAAAIVMRTVRNTVDTGRTVVCTIHQPSIDIFEAFDELLLMKRGGQVIYAGPLGHNSQKLIEYFEAIAGVPKIKDGYNPATWMLEISTPSIEAQLGVDFADIYANSTLNQRNQELIKELSTPSPDLFDLMGAMYSTVMFLGTMNAVGVQPVVDTERTVLYRERAAGMYSALPYALGQVVIEAMYSSVQTAMYTIVIHSMMGFEWKAGKLFWFYYYMLMCFIYFTLYGMMTIALTPTYQIASICISFFLCIWNLFSGFFLPRKQIPVWWRWFYWATPNAWTIYGLVTSQLGDKIAQIDVPGVQSVGLKELLKENLGFEYDFLPVVAVVHVVWVLIFLFGFAYGMKFLNFQKR